MASAPSHLALVRSRLFYSFFVLRLQSWARQISQQHPEARPRPALRNVADSRQIPVSFAEYLSVQMSA